MRKGTQGNSIAFVFFGKGYFQITLGAFLKEHPVLAAAGKFGWQPTGT